MKLYTVPNCDSCQKVISFIQQNNSTVDVVELTKIDGKWYEMINGNMIAADERLTSFPALFIGDKDASRYYVYGDMACISYIGKGFIHDLRTCPFLNSDCIEKKCEKFVLMNKGLIVEGGCADSWTPILITELISQEKKNGNSS
jgi:glutaredoxin